MGVEGVGGGEGSVRSESGLVKEVFNTNDL